jgi:hypothetical protein
MLKGPDQPVLILHGVESKAYRPHAAAVMDECLSRAEVAAPPASIITGGYAIP